MFCFTKEIEYTYDVFGRRIAKSIDWDGEGANPAEEIQYIYDGFRSDRGNAGDHIILAFDGDDALTNRYLHGPDVDQVLADEQVPAGDLFWMLADNLGSVRDVVDNDGTVLNHIVYDSFGNVVSESDDTVDVIFGYTGRERDEESDLQYNRYRYYDARVGRWISEDPLGFAAGDSNLNRYVGNGVVNATDPSGLHEKVDRPQPKPPNTPTFPNEHIRNKYKFGAVIDGGSNTERWPTEEERRAALEAELEEKMRRAAIERYINSTKSRPCWVADNRTAQQRLYGQYQDWIQSDEGKAWLLEHNLTQADYQIAVIMALIPLPGPKGVRASKLRARINLSPSLYSDFLPYLHSQGRLYPRLVTPKFAPPIGKFPVDPGDLTRTLCTEPKITTTQHGTRRYLWEPNSNTRIRFESHPRDAGPFNPRHHGEHYHIEIKPPHLSWNQAKKQGLITKIKPGGYRPGHGTGHLPGEPFPGR